jgi:hypothetical protein
LLCEVNLLTATKFNGKNPNENSDWGVALVYVLNHRRRNRPRLGSRRCDHICNKSLSMGGHFTDDSTYMSTQFEATGGETLS